MRFRELLQLSEVVNPKIFDDPVNSMPMWGTKPVAMGDFMFDARTFTGGMGDSDAVGLQIRAYDPKKSKTSSIGSADFIVKKDKKGNSWLESDDTEVDPEYQGKGVATLMYAFAKSLGNDIKPSPYQSVAGQNMWAKWGKDAKNLSEVGDSPAEYQPNRKRKRSLFHSTVDGHWVDVFFDRSEFNGTLHITFTVDGNYDTPTMPTKASKSIFKILSTVLNIVKKQLPEYISKARPPALSFTAKEDNRAGLYRKYFVPVIQNILGDKWQLEEYPNMGMTVFNWKPKKKAVTESNEIQSAKYIVKYINSIHPEALTKHIEDVVLSYPKWKLETVNLHDLHIPDQDYDDPDQEPEEDPYNRVMMIDPGHAGEVSSHYIDKRPIVIDHRGYILDGNHRAWAAAELYGKDTIRAWVPE